MSVEFDIRNAETQADFDAVRALCWEYRDFLLDMGPADAEIVRAYYPDAKYQELMTRLEQVHVPPTGGLKLVERDGVPLGCGMFHSLFPGVAEVKRVYLRPELRGMGAGRALMQALIDQCRAAGFREIVMDTSKTLETARALYLSMGFRLCGPYQDVPEMAKDLIIYFEMEL